MTQRAVPATGWLLALWLAAGTAFAQAPVEAVPEGELVSGGELVDREFGVGTHRFGLDRRVEMFQWLRSGADRYERAWKAALVDSSGFAAGHDNPPSIPLDSRRMWAQDATLDGRPIDVTVLKVLGRWEDFRPGFSRLPGNLSATFQPDGDGLTSSENPLDPRIGDLRVSWRELVLPPLAGRVQLVDGTWQLVPLDSRRPAAPASPRMSAAVAATQTPEAPASRWPWWVGGGVLLVAGLAWLLRRRR